MEEQNQNWKDVVYEQDPEEKKQKKGRKKVPKRMKLVIGAAVAAVVLLPAAAGSFSTARLWSDKARKASPIRERNGAQCAVIFAT